MSTSIEQNKEPDIDIYWKKNLEVGELHRVKRSEGQSRNFKIFRGTGEVVGGAGISPLHLEFLKWVT